MHCHNDSELDEYPSRLLSIFTAGVIFIVLVEPQRYKSHNTLGIRCLAVLAKINTQLKEKT